MLSMKTLRVAIVTMGSALLLGSGLAAAAIQTLDGDMPPAVVKYASQTVPIAVGDTRTATDDAYTPPGATRPSHYRLKSPTEDADGMNPNATTHKLAFSPSRRIDATDNAYIRLDLGGGLVFAPDANSDLEFGADATQSGTPAATYANRIAGGAAGNTFIVYKSGAVALDNAMWVDVFDDLAAPAGAGSYMATVRSYGTADDAIDGRGVTSTASGSATIIEVQSGIAAEVKAGTTATAEVSTRPEPFLWFEADTENGISNMAVLGSATAVANNAGGVFNADTGVRVDNATLVPDMSLTLVVEGDFSIGAFTLMIPMDDTNTTDDDESMDPSTICAGPGSADDDMPVPGNVNAATSEEDPMTATITMANPGTHHLCVQVDRMGALSNRMAIPETSYMGAIYIGAGDDAELLDDGVIGVIERNGASVELPYLTTSAKHNQRLILVNRGPVDVHFTLTGFYTEDGTDVELTALAMVGLEAGLNVVRAGESVVARVSHMLSITGDSARTAATINFNGAKQHISVATTQVNLADGSTDTVLYETQ